MAYLIRIVGNDPLKLRDLTIPPRPDQEIEVVGTDSRAAGVLRLLSNEPPAHALAIYLPARLERLEVVREVARLHPHLHVLVLTDRWAEREFLIEVLRAGGKGCIAGDAKPDFFADSCRLVANGRGVFDLSYLRHFVICCPSRESLGLPALGGLGLLALRRPPGSSNKVGRADSTHPPTGLKFCPRGLQIPGPMADGT